MGQRFLLKLVFQITFGSLNKLQINETANWKQRSFPDPDKRKYQNIQKT
jgi:hypothetical protein